MFELTHKCYVDAQGGLDLYWRRHPHQPREQGMRLLKAYSKCRTPASMIQGIVSGLDEADDDSRYNYIELEDEDGIAWESPIQMATAYTAATTTTSMAATAVFTPASAIAKPPRYSTLAYLPLPRFTTPAFSTSLKLLSEPRRLSLLQVKASSSEESSPPVDTDELFSGLKEKWDAVENKSTVILYGGGAIVVVWLSSVVVGAVNSVPLQSRKELATDIEALKKKIVGTE
ncbi:hypothetical protein Acr_00g0059230 [Actinidia rufa]|uniref:Uncharacterized protein n=1 Tax=Actinidia rufa TaxID=165716 RepID=A0A7J0DQ30_9ERIC|nr:hypothetical protein Acr_00g0059230 [Actinidia rufa]